MPGLDQSRPDDGDAGILHPCISAVADTAFSAGSSPDTRTVQYHGGAASSRKSSTTIWLPVRNG